MTEETPLNLMHCYNITHTMNYHTHLRANNTLLCGHYRRTLRNAHFLPITVEWETLAMENFGKSTNKAVGELTRFTKNGESAKSKVAT